MQNWKLFAIVLPIFLLLDLLWLGVVMKGFYSRELGELARRQGAVLAPRWGAVMLVYLLIPGGIVMFVRPLLGENGTAWQAFGWGAIFGLVLYGVYDLTNLAVLDKWTLHMTLADMMWGCVLCGTISVVMIELNNKYALDGRNPNSYSGIFRVLGRYDRPWGPERPIFGSIRYMSSDNTRKIVSVGAYLKAYS